MSYSSYNDPTGRTQFTKELWKTTNTRNDAHVKMMDEIAAEKRRLDGLSLSGTGGNGKASSGSGASFWLAAGLLLGGYVVLQLL